MAQEQEERRYKVDMEVRDQLDIVREKLAFIADYASNGEMELTAEGRGGLYWILQGIGQDIERAIME